MKSVLLIVLLGVAAIMLGMAAKNFIKYAPTIGWLLGFFLFLIATIVAFKIRSQK